MNRPRSGEFKSLIAISLLYPTIFKVTSLYCHGVCHHWRFCCLVLGSEAERVTLFDSCDIIGDHISISASSTADQETKGCIRPSVDSFARFAYFILTTTSRASPGSPEISGRLMSFQYTVLSLHPSNRWGGGLFIHIYPLPVKPWQSPSSLDIETLYFLRAYVSASISKLKHDGGTTDLVTVGVGVQGDPR